MAQYSADIRVGIIGKQDLNSLEKQLSRVNKDLTQINKKVKRQTLAINTKGANRAIDGLERRLNRLGRTITVNLRVNEQARERGSTTVVANEAAAPAAVGLRIAKQRQVVQKQITTELKDQSAALKTQDRLAEQIKQIDDDIRGNKEKIAKLNKTLPEQGGSRSNKEAIQQLQDAGKLSRKYSQQFDRLKERLKDISPVEAGKEFKKFYENTLPESAKKFQGIAEDAARKQIQTARNTNRQLAQRRDQLLGRTVAAEKNFSDT